MTRPTNRPRRGFTLIEMVIVIAIIALLATLGALFLPLLDRNKGVPNGVTAISGHIRLAKNHALRDGAPRGVRLLQDPNDPTRVNALQYIEQPEPLAPRGTVTVAPNQIFRIALLITTANPNATTAPPNVAPYPNPSPAIATLVLVDPATGQPVAGWNWDDPADPRIGPGDFLELSTSPHIVARVIPVPLPQTNPGPSSIPQFAGPTRSTLILDRAIDGTETAPLLLFEGFRIIRAPRPLAGEPIVQLHKDIYIDLTWSYPCPILLNHPVSGLPVPNGAPPYGNTYTGFQPWSPSGPLDILFNSSGQMANAPTGQLILAVRHVDKQPANPGDFPPDMLFVVIYTRTGRVAAISPYDVGGADPYTLARDGRASGL